MDISLSKVYPLLHTQPTPSTHRTQTQAGALWGPAVSPSSAQPTGKHSPRPVASGHGPSPESTWGPHTCSAGWESKRDLKLDLRPLTLGSTEAAPSLD